MPARLPAPSRPVSGWLLALCAAWGLLAMALLPLVLPAGPAEALRGAFHLLCHQLPERSLASGGRVAALCHRCTGLVLGLGLGLLGYPLARRPSLSGSRRRARLLGALALAPLVVDWALGAAGLWTNTPLSRVLTGALFGAYAGLVLAEALGRTRAEAHAEAHAGYEGAPEDDAVVLRVTKARLVP